MKIILVIDHDSFSRTVLKDKLYGHYHVFAMASGTEAIDLAQHQSLDLILLDMEMPEGNGAEICSLLKETNATKYAPLILLSSCSQKEDIINGLHAGADDYMTKPVCASELLARIIAVQDTRELKFRGRNIKKLDGKIVLCKFRLSFSGCCPILENHCQLRISRSHGWHLEWIVQPQPYDMSCQQWTLASQAAAV